MPGPILECVPNFSEGRDPAVIEAIAAAIRAVDGVRLLDVDPGRSTNRTVYTFAGDPEAVCEAAFQAARVGSELIDMTRQHGEHPRFGALDVCPLIPVSGITMEEAVEWARRLGQRLGDELGLTIYLYGQAALDPARSDLALIRGGEYEGLPEKLTKPEWTPNYGPTTFNARSGATAVGARDFLIAYNVNLNTTSVRRANSVAFDLREKGRMKRIGDPIVGEIVRDAAGQPVYEPGVLKAVKAIGWVIEEYGIAQVSMNLTDLKKTPIHIAFDECCEKATERGIRVTGSELIGLIPLGSMLEAGRYFLRKQRRSTGVSDRELIKIAVRTMGLDELSPFDPATKIIEYALRDPAQKRLVDFAVQGFVEETASESAAPGGGSVSALMSALGAALGTMVANLSAHKRGWDDRWNEFSDWADRGKALHDELTVLVDEDTLAFNALMAAFGLPKGTDEEKAARKAAIQDATKTAVLVPLRVMERSLETFEVLAAMAEHGNPNSVSDAGVGALAVRSGILGAHLNVRINCSSLDDHAFVSEVTAKAQTIAEQAQAREREVLEIVDRKLAEA